MNCKKILLIIIVIICIIVLCFCSYLLFKDFQELNNNNQCIDELIESTIKIDEYTDEKNIDWDYLKLVNKDIIGWIEIEGTNINYPILKDDNLYYLTHTYKREYNRNGSIFTTNLNPFIEQETIVYGHNMKNKSMFSELIKYLNEKYFYSNNKIMIYTPTANYIGKIFSVYSIDVELETNNIKSLNFDKRLKYYKDMSKYYVEINEDTDKILKLSTCSYINNKYTPTEQRCFVIASIVQIK